MTPQSPIEGLDQQSSLQVEAESSSPARRAFPVWPPKDITQGLFSDDLQDQLGAIKEVGRAFQAEINSPLYQVTQSGVLPRLVKLLRSDSSDVQADTAWALGTIAMSLGDHDQAIIQAGALPGLVDLLSFTTPNVLLQTTLTLEIIANSSEKCLLPLRSAGILQPLLELILNHELIEVRRAALSTFAELCVGKFSSSDWVVISPKLPALVELIESSDEGILSQICRALSWLLHSSKDRVGLLMTRDVCTRLVQLMSHSSPLVHSPALVSIKNVTYRNDFHNATVVSCGVIPTLPPLLSSPDNWIANHACDTVTNVLSNYPRPVQAVISADIIPRLFALIGRGNVLSWSARWAILNAIGATRLEPHQVDYLVSQGCVDLACQALTWSFHTKAIVSALRALRNILEVGEMYKQAAGPGAINKYAALIEEIGGLAVIHAKQEDSSWKIKKQAMQLMETYFLDDDIEVPGDEWT